MTIQDVMLPIITLVVVMSFYTSNSTKIANRNKLSISIHKSMFNNNLSTCYNVTFIHNGIYDSLIKHSKYELSAVPKKKPSHRRTRIRRVAWMKRNPISKSLMFDCCTAKPTEDDTVPDFENFVTKKGGFAPGLAEEVEVEHHQILEPITQTKIVEVTKEIIEEKIIEVPDVQIVEKIVEVDVPVIKYKPVYKKTPVVVEKVKHVPKIVYEDKIIEVPQVQYVEKEVEVPQIVYKEKIIEEPKVMVVEHVIPVLKVKKAVMTARDEEVPEDIMQELDHMEQGDAHDDEMAKAACCAN